MIKFDPQTEGYTDDEKIIFDLWLTGNDSLSMYVYSQVALPTKFADLYNSFTKWTELSKEQKSAGSLGKGYYQGIIDNLIRQGEEEFNKWLTEHQDNGEVEEHVNEMTYQLIKDRAI